MKRILFVIAWTVGTFFAAVLGYGILCGVIFVFVEEDAEKLAFLTNYIAPAGGILSFVVPSTFFRLALLGRLPGTRAG